MISTLLKSLSLKVPNLKQRRVFSVLIFSLWNNQALLAFFGRAQKMHAMTMESHSIINSFD